VLGTTSTCRVLSSVSLYFPQDICSWLSDEACIKAAMPPRDSQSQGGEKEE
jgi:hypothetical protein